MSELIGTRYPTRDELKAAIRSYAIKNGFAVKQTINGQGTGILFKCCCEGDGNEDKLGENRKRKKKSTQRSGCKWQLTASLPKKSKEDGQDPLWEIRVLRLHSGQKFDTKKQKTLKDILDEGEDLVHHNHLLIKNNQKALCKAYSQYRKCTDATTDTVPSRH